MDSRETKLFSLGSNFPKLCNLCWKTKSLEQDRDLVPKSVDSNSRVCKDGMIEMGTSKGASTKTITQEAPKQGIKLSNQVFASQHFYVMQVFGRMCPRVPRNLNKRLCEWSDHGEIENWKAGGFQRTKACLVGINRHQQFSFHSVFWWFALA